jgi:hypothetical protein
VIILLTVLPLPPPPTQGPDGAQRDEGHVPSREGRHEYRQT